jgi:hypothetical protein
LVVSKFARVLKTGVKVCAEVAMALATQNAVTRKAPFQSTFIFDLLFRRTSLSQRHRTGPYRVVELRTRCSRSIVQAGKAARSAVFRTQHDSSLKFCQDEKHFR